MLVDLQRRPPGERGGLPLLQDPQEPPAHPAAGLGRVAAHRRVVLEGRRGRQLGDRQPQQLQRLRLAQRQAGLQRQLGQLLRQARAARAPQGPGGAGRRLNAAEPHVVADVRLLLHGPVDNARPILAPLHPVPHLRHVPAPQGEAPVGGRDPQDVPLGAPPPTALPRMLGRRGVLGPLSRHFEARHQVLVLKLAPLLGRALAPAALPLEEGPEADLQPQDARIDTLRAKPDALELVDCAQEVPHHSECPVPHPHKLQQPNCTKHRAQDAPQEEPPADALGRRLLFVPQRQPPL
mmetsp:Transcript_49398/g.143202  ORF Transcript_49398/g.143202 Transcript_49398/m.143202 type:complete len:293 (-) Transcript_49398:805-1683(-)